MSQNGLPHLAALQTDSVWLEAPLYNEAEKNHHQLLVLNDVEHPQKNKTNPRCKNEALSVEKTNIYNGYESTTSFNQLLVRVQKLEDERAELRQKVAEMNNAILELQNCIKSSVGAFKNEKEKTAATSANGTSVITGVTNDEDDIDLFGSDEETEEERRIKEQRLKMYAEKKSKKPSLVAKSSIVLDVKPWDDETDMKKLEACVREIVMDGLKWGAGKLVPLAYGINKFQIVAIIEDEKVSVDLLQEKIEEHEDLVQSVDIAAFNKL